MLFAAVGSTGVVASDRRQSFEQIMMVVVEVVKDAMLSVTMAMIMMGVLFLFPGFFIQVSGMPV